MFGNNNNDNDNDDVNDDAVGDADDDVDDDVAISPCWWFALEYIPGRWPVDPLRLKWNEIRNMWKCIDKDKKVDPHRLANEKDVKWIDKDKKMDPIRLAMKRICSCLDKEKKKWTRSARPLKRVNNVNMYEHWLVRKLHDVETKVNDQLDLEQRGGSAVKAAGN